MSLIGDIIAPYALIASPLRAIGTIIPDVVVEEIHSDDLAITDHPVESGAAISDHAFRLPARVEMRCGWSNSTVGSEGYVQSVYEALLALQQEREPFDVYTGKRAYRNMLIGRLAVETTEKSESALLLVCGLREVIITQTQQASAPAGSQAMPEKTGSITDTGTSQAVQVPGIVSPGLTTQISPNAVLFGSGIGEGGTGFRPGGGTFGFGGPTGPSPY